MQVFGPKAIEHYIQKFVIEHGASFRGRTVIDLPAGDGYVSTLFANAGATVEAFDLFTEPFCAPGLTCRQANLSHDLPIADAHADTVWCSEAVEHLPNQVRAFLEFNRILKPGGRLLLTTRNYSSLRSRVAYLAMESEQCFGGLMPPNELDSVWYADDQHPEAYFGHAFVVGVQKLRALARITGFRIHRIHHLRVNRTSLLLFPFLYPFIALVSLVSYFQAMRKRSHVPRAERRAVYREQLRLNLDPRILLDQHLFVEFVKESDVRSIRPASLNKFADVDRVDRSSLPRFAART